MYQRIVIGIDPSYNRTGISISADGSVKDIKSIDLSKVDGKRLKRLEVKRATEKALIHSLKKANEVEVIVERIRLRSGPILSIDYIKSISALIATISDIAGEYGVPCYSVDTRCWKAQVVGTSKGMPNIYGVPEEKWPTLKWAIGLGFESKLLIPVYGRKLKGTFERSDRRYMYDNDAADSAAISLFGFVGDRSKLKVES